MNDKIQWILSELRRAIFRTLLIMLKRIASMQDAQKMMVTSSNRLDDGTDLPRT